MKPSQLVLKLRQSITYPYKSFGEGDEDPRSPVFKVRLFVELFTSLFPVGEKTTTKTEEGSFTGKVAKIAALAAGAFALLKTNDASASAPSGYAELSPPVKTEQDRTAVQKALEQQAPVVGEPPKKKDFEFKPETVTDSAIKTVKDEVRVTPVEHKKPELLPDVGSEPIKPSKTVQGVAQAQAGKRPAETAPKTGSLGSLITKAANDIGVDPETLKAFVMLESSGNVMARSKTGALGLTQFTSIAWEEAANKGGKAYGIEHPIPKDIKGTKDDPRFDPYKNLIAGAILLREGSKFLTKHGIEPTVTALYSYHNIGPTSTLAVYGKAEHTAASRKAIANQGAGFTESNYLSKTQQRVELAQAQVQSGPTVMASVVTTGTTPSQVASAPSGVALTPSTATVTQGPSDTKPVVLTKAEPESVKVAAASPSVGAPTFTSGQPKPQQFYKDRNGHLVVA